ncbi:MAG: tetratricopeptide repeat protein [Clostridium sp.]
MKLINKKYIIYFIITVIIVISSIFGVKHMKNKKYLQDNNRAKILCIDEKYDGAIDVYKNMLKEYKNQDEILNNLIEVYYMTNRLEEGRGYIEQLWSLESKFNVEDKIILDKLLSGDIKEAKEMGEGFLEKSQSKEVIKIMPLIYLCNDEYEKAEEAIAKFEGMVTYSDDYVDLASMYLLAEDKSQKVYEVLFKAWNKDKNNVRIYDLIEEKASYNNDKTMEEIEVLIRKEPQELAYKTWLLKAYSITEEYNDISIKLLKEIKDENLGGLDIRLIEASILLYSKDEKNIKTANNIFAQLLSDGKNDYKVYNILSRFNVKKNEDKSLEQYKKSIMSNGNYGDNYGALKCDILSAFGLEKGGDEEFRKYLYLEPYNFKGILKIGQYYKSVNKLEEAIKWYDLAEVLLPSSLNIKNTIVQLHLENKQKYINKGNTYSDVEEKEYIKQKEVEEKEAAIMELEQCIKIANYDEKDKYYRILGTVYMIDNNNDNALENYVKAYEYNAENPKNLSNLASYYISINGDIDKAKEYMDKAKELLGEESDKYVIEIVTDNYNKVVELQNRYYLAKHKEVLEIPEFKYFY